MSSKFEAGTGNDPDAGLEDDIDALAAAILAKDKISGEPKAFGGSVDDAQSNKNLRERLADALQEIRRVKNGVIRSAGAKKSKIPESERAQFVVMIEEMYAEAHKQVQGKDVDEEHLALIEDAISRIQGEAKKVHAGGAEKFHAGENPRKQWFEETFKNQNETFDKSIRDADSIEILKKGKHGTARDDFNFFRIEDYVDYLDSLKAPERRTAYKRIVAAERRLGILYGERMRELRGSLPTSAEDSDAEQFATLAAALRKRRKPFGTGKDGKELVIERIDDAEIRYRYGEKTLTTKPKFVKRFLQFLEEQFSWSLGKKKATEPKRSSRAEKAAAEEAKLKEPAQAAKDQLPGAIEDRKKWAAEFFAANSGKITQGSYNQLLKYLDTLPEVAEVAFKEGRYKRVIHILEDGARKAVFMDEKPAIIQSRQPAPTGLDLDDESRNQGNGLTDEQKDELREYQVKVKAQKAAKKAASKNGGSKTVTSAAKPEKKKVAGNSDWETYFESEGSIIGTKKDGTRVSFDGATGSLIVEYPDNDEETEKTTSTLDQVKARFGGRIAEVQHEDDKPLADGAVSKEQQKPQERTYEELGKELKPIKKKQCISVVAAGLAQFSQVADKKGVTLKAFLEQEQISIEEIISEIMQEPLGEVLPAEWSDQERAQFAMRFARNEMTESLE